MPVQCYQCSHADEAKPLEVFDVKFRSKHGFMHNVDQQKGGVILLGAEEFGNNQCDLKQVKYSTTL